jgi:hypothetical protein
VDYQNLRKVIAPGPWFARLSDRLGPLTLFNPLDTTALEFSYDLADPAQRAIAQIVCQIQFAEKNGKLSSSQYNSAPLVPPKQWKKQVPLSGVWSGTYVGVESKSGPSGLRKRLAIQYCNFDARTFGKRK